jgi:hypothetical protein
MCLPLFFAIVTNIYWPNMQWKTRHPAHTFLLSSVVVLPLMTEGRPRSLLAAFAAEVFQGRRRQTMHGPVTDPAPTFRSSSSASAATATPTPGCWLAWVLLRVHRVRAEYGQSDNVNFPGGNQVR